MTKVRIIKKPVYWFKVKDLWKSKLSLVEFNYNFLTNLLRENNLLTYFLLKEFGIDPPNDLFPYHIFSLIVFYLQGWHRWRRGNSYLFMFSGVSVCAMSITYIRTKIQTYDQGLPGIWLQKIRHLCPDFWRNIWYR